MIDLSGPPVRLPPPALELARACWQRELGRIDPDAPSPPHGLPELREVLGQLLDEDPEQIWLTSGARAAVPVLGTRLADIVVEAPSFSGIPALLGSLGHHVRRASWADLPAADAIWLTSPARNPDGATLTAEEVDRLRAGPWRTVVLNEAYRWHSLEPPPPLLPSWFAVGTFAKVLGPGVRLGWLRGPSVRDCEPHTLKVSEPPLLAQAAWASFLHQGGLALTQPVRARVQAAAAAFRSIAAPVLREFRAATGPSLLTALADGWTVPAAVSALAGAGVRVNPGDAFDSPVPAVRVNFTAVSVAEAAQAGELFRSVLDS